jgi:hypothetical protein
VVIFPRDLSGLEASVDSQVTGRTSEYGGLPILSGDA